MLSGAERGGESTTAGPVRQGERAPIRCDGASVALAILGGRSPLVRWGWRGRAQGEDHDVSTRMRAVGCARGGIPERKRSTIKRLPPQRGQAGVGGSSWAGCGLV